MYNNKVCISIEPSNFATEQIKNERYEKNDQTIIDLMGIIGYYNQ